MHRETPAGRVLVVDDDPEVAYLLRELFSSMGYTVAVALTGEDGLAQVATFQPDTVLLDLTLPGMTGAEVLDAIRASYPGIPVLAMTGDPHRAAGIVARGAVGYVPKPFSVPSVREAVRVALEARR